MNGESVDPRQALRTLRDLWWLWIVFGVAWIAISLVILDENQASKEVVGLVIGLMFLYTAAQNMLLAWLSDGGLKWFFAIFSGLFIVAGLWAIANPHETFKAIADVLGFLFVLLGVFWLLEAFAVRQANELWWFGVIGGLLMVVLGFITGGQLFWEKQQILLTVAGVWALIHGIVDLTRAYMFHSLK